MTKQDSTTGEREEIARTIARELMRQEFREVSDSDDPFDGADLTWSYIDQGEVDFGKIADAILSRPARMAASSEGWVLVPVEPDAAMIWAGRCAVSADGRDALYVSDAYRAMLSARSDTGRGEPWMAEHHTRHPWAASGDQPERLWVLRFNDPDQAEMSWRGPDAERDAKDAYRRYSVAWTCALLATVPMVEPMLAASPPPVAVPVSEERVTQEDVAEVWLGWRLNPNDGPASHRVWKDALWRAGKVLALAVPDKGVQG